VATLPAFSLGQSASASQINQAFNTLQSQGNSILGTMSKIQLTTLVDYQRRLTALNARRQRAARVQANGIVARFVVSDFDDIDQGQSTATVRVDTSAATLRERREPSQVLVSSTSFTASSGTVQAIDANSTLFSVYNSYGVPTGTFNLTLSSLVSVSLLTIDISAMASSPTIAVSVSANGLTWTDATQITINGYRLNAWLPQTQTKYIKLVVTPSHPDNLGGSTYTFGITDLSGTSVDYNLVSNIFIKPIVFPVQAAQVQLIASTDDGLTYYLTLDDGTNPTAAVVVTPSTPIHLPSVAAVSQTVVSTGGLLGLTLPANVVAGTVAVVDANGNDLPVVPGLSTTDPNIAALVNPHISLVGTALNIVPAPAGTPQYTVSYLTGPASITATLRVHLSTSDATITPIFSGAYLEVIA
jgi:hypothetical protein